MEAYDEVNAHGATMDDGKENPACNRERQWWSRYTSAMANLGMAPGKRQLTMGGDDEEEKDGLIR